MTSLHISPEKPSQPSMDNTERVWKHMCSAVSVYDIAGEVVHATVIFAWDAGPPLCHSNP